MISGCTSGGGGGVAAIEAVTMIFDAHISDCEAGGGGGILVNFGDLSLNGITPATILNQVTIEDCTAVEGGGIFADRYGDFKLLNSSKILNCTADHMGNLFYTTAGGGLFVLTPTCLVDDATISGCSADLYGGAIQSSSPQFTITDSTVEGNSAFQGGGIQIPPTSTKTLIDRCTFAKNEALSGGGLYFDDENCTIRNSTFSGNLAGVGGRHHDRRPRRLLRGRILHLHQ